MITLIWAEARGRVIGKENRIPWYLPQDMLFFKEQTIGGVVIMGRKTWESIPEKFRPLVGRVNIVMSNDPEYTAPGTLVVHNMNEALFMAAYNPNVFVIGGGWVYEQFMLFADRIIKTEIDHDIYGDAFAPEIDMTKWQVSRETHWAESNPPEHSTLSGANNLRYRHVFLTPNHKEIKV